MRLDFKVLWIDDQPSHVKSFREGIERRLIELGFKLDVTEVKTLSDVKPATEHVHNDGIDLILVDYDMGSGGGGEKALAEVRAKFPHKDIIFYSANDRNKLREIAFGQSIDGLYFSTRLSLVEDTCGVIGKMLHKVLDLDHMRGVVMAATSDIDFLVEESLIALYNKLDADKQAAFRTRVVEVLEKKLSGWQSDLKKAATKEKLEAILKLKMLCSSADRLNLLIDELAGSDGAGTHLTSAQKYREEVVPRRNKLAHVRLKITDGKSSLQGKDVTFSVEDMTQLRRDLIDHRQNFNDIAVLVDVEFS